MSHRRCFALDLVDDADLIEEYEALHAPRAVWPEIIADIRASGFGDMEIWRTGDRCFMIAEVADDFPRPRSAEAQAAVDRWEHRMWRYQQALPHAAPGEKWVEMRRIFALAEQDAPPSS
ncbi:L-rhamnose mutarotase [Sphingomonas sp.]|uniref:L-rhamnose mutarotase n=1 Tax=Sphingomonas sp. TaxID=28214 RepID=UPI002ED7E299